MSSILKAQDAYINSGVSRFHTPGHAAKSEVLSRFSQVLPYDVTEVESFDSLYHADGILAECEQTAERLFDARRTLISAGGCTLAIQTMLALAVPSGGKVAMGRNAHRTAVNTLALLDLHPVWIYPKTGVVTPEEVGEVLENQTVDAVYVTSPDYYGRLCDIATIATLCHQKGIPLLVDNAHGAHLKFLHPDRHPLTLGADMTACSVHKTLPVLTGGAFLNIAQEQYVQSAKGKMELFGSTSPSYLTMASIDSCLDWLHSKGQQAFSTLSKKAEQLKKDAQSMGFFLPQEPCDPVRFTLNVRKNGIDGQTAHRVFLECGAVCEYYDRDNIVFILTPFHDEQDFSRLYKGLGQLMKLQSMESAEQKNSIILSPARPVLSVRQAVFSDCEVLRTDGAAGKIAAEAICPCPPGIPVVIPGEMIDNDAVSVLKYSGIDTIKVVK